MGPARAAPSAGSLLASLHPDDRNGTDVRALCQRGLSAAADFQFRIVRPGGHLRWVRVRSSPTRHGTGAVTGYHGVVISAAVRSRDDHSVPA